MGQKSVRGKCEPGMDLRVNVCVWAVSSNVELALLCCDTSNAYRAVLEERLPHVSGEPFVGITRHIGSHYGVIDESREVCTHSRQVTAVCQPWVTIQASDN